MTLAGNDLRGRVALVTSGGRGIGRAIATALAAAGADVAIAARTVAELDEAAAGIRAHGVRALGRLDVLEPVDVAPLAAFLASPAAGGISGQVLSADGGFMIGG